MDMDYASKTIKFYIKDTGKKMSSMEKEDFILYLANIKAISKQE